MSHGDFVSRRLPSSFITVWDAWLQAGIQHSRTQLGDAWTGIYLSSPIWRFALAPGVCDDTCWIGMLMPSADRVGRRFPLTLCVEVPNTCALVATLAAAKPWLDEIERLALSTLDFNFSFEVFDAALASMSVQFAAVASCLRSGDAPGIRLPVAEAANIETEMPVLIQGLMEFTVRHHSLWWSDGSNHVAASMLISKGLPTPAQFVSMLSGQWEDGEWRELAAPC
jgi:type VI secretion system protein ImpM